MDDLISRKAAIDALAEMYCKSDEDGYVWIIRGDAWKRIDALPAAQSESDPEWRKKHYEASYAQGFVDSCKLYERKKGKWHRRFYPQVEMIVCSECQEEFSYDAETGVGDYNYCPNCGADMRGEEHDK